MKGIDIFGINKEEVISLVGSAGKTTLLHGLGKYYGESNKVLLTTSAKMILPDTHELEYEYYENIDKYLEVPLNGHKNITIIAPMYRDNKQKVKGLLEEELTRILNKKLFDYIFIEADGSKNLPIKAWKKHEPPILPQTNKTIGIFPFPYLGKKINSSFIYGYEEFLSSFSRSERVDYQTLFEIITHPEGMFKNSDGEKILYLNHVEDIKTMNRAYDLCNYLRKNLKKHDIRIIIGSTLKGVFDER